MLQMEHISVQAGHKGPVLLNDISLQCRPGELLVVLGANGAGKSTLLRAIGGELPVRGDIRWKGSPIHDLSLAGLACERACLDQHGEVPFAFTAREVVMMGRYPHTGHLPGLSDEAAVERAMHLMQVTPYQHREMPSLSGGERKRAQVARIIAQLDNGRPGPTLLLLDEPLNDLDVKHQHGLMKFARQHAEAGHCVLAVLHDLNMAARHGHRLLLLKHGRALALGTPREVLTPAHLSKAYDMPAHVLAHPVDGGPWVHFGMAPANEQRPTIALPHAVPAALER